MRFSRLSPLQVAMISIVAAYAACNLYIRFDRDYLHPRRVSALFEAIRDGRVDEVDRLTRIDASLVNVYAPKERVVQPFSGYLGEETTNLYARPLSFAILRGSASIARLLVERGASLESRNYNDFTNHADPEGQGGSLPCVRFGNDWDRQVSPLHLAVMWNNRALVELFLEKGIDVNVADRDGYRLTTGHDHAVGGTPLHCAAELGYAEMASLLIARGANPSDRDLLGRTPLDLARHNQHPEVARLLVAAGGRPGAPHR